ncbi:MAG: aminoacyl-tRNA hydrolase [Candidatus Portnoybacteria bacterium]|nr:aminoacyl-tRNA hydrolase [Candidatus Portnoybacteria bacterium]
MENFNFEKIDQKKEDNIFLEITEDDVDLKFVRSSGPGGQNVNKSSTCAQLRFSIRESGKLTEDQKNILLRELPKLGVIINRNGEACLEASNERSQDMNKKAVTARLNDYVRRALIPKKERKETQPTRSSKERRMEEKRRQGQKKADRQKVKW